MTNYEMCNGNYSRLLELWSKRLKYRIDNANHSRHSQPNIDMTKWICATADVALEFDIGEVIVDEDGNYSIVESYVEDLYTLTDACGRYCVATLLNCRCADGVHQYSPDRVKHAPIPKGLMEIARRQVIESIKCPFSGSGKGE